MFFDVALVALIVAGIALAAAYVRAEYLSWREHGAVQRRREAAQRDLHAASFSEQRDALLPSVLKLQGFGKHEAANYPLAERRKRLRQRAR
jgi:hypothetical protein